MKNVISKLLKWLLSMLEGKMILKADLLLLRKVYSDKSIMGELYLNKQFNSYTLELPDLQNQRSISCIPEGTYNCRLRLPRESASRNYIHILVQDVPNRDYILFHRGNSPKDSRGCILLGKTRKNNWVGQSSIAMAELVDEMLENKLSENITLTIKNEQINEV